MLLEGIGINRQFQPTHRQRIVGRRDALVAMLNEGMNMRQIAERFGVSRGTIRWVMKDLGLRSQHTRCCTPKWANRQDELLAMLRQGMSRGQIAKEFGVTRNVIVGACYRLGLAADAQVQDQLAQRREMAQQIAERRLKDRQRRYAAKLAKGLQTKKAAKPSSQWRSHIRADVPPPDSATRCTIMSLGWPEGLGRCRYIVDDNNEFYCGAPTETEMGSWCPYHAQFVFQNRMSGDVGGSLAAASRTGVEPPCSPANAARPHQSQEAAAA